MLRRFSMNHIDVTMEGELEDIRWQFVGFSGHLMENLRHHSWDLLRNLVSDNGDPLLVMEDFNEIMYSTRNKGKG